jgi:hypothetical protein
MDGPEADAEELVSDTLFAVTKNRRSRKQCSARFCFKGSGWYSQGCCQLLFWGWRIKAGNHYRELEKTIEQVV